MSSLTCTGLSHECPGDDGAAGWHQVLTVSVFWELSPFLMMSPRSLVLLGGLTQRCWMKRSPLAKPHNKGLSQLLSARNVGSV